MKITNRLQIENNKAKSELFLSPKQAVSEWKPGGNGDKKLRLEKVLFLEACEHVPSSCVPRAGVATLPQEPHHRTRQHRWLQLSLALDQSRDRLQWLLAQSQSRSFPTPHRSQCLPADCPPLPPPVPLPVFPHCHSFFRGVRMMFCQQPTIFMHML